MDPPELASKPPRSRIELRAAFNSIGLGNVRAYLESCPIKRIYDIKQNATSNIIIFHLWSMYKHLNIYLKGLGCILNNYGHIF